MGTVPSSHTYVQCIAYKNTCLCINMMISASLQLIHSTRSVLLNKGSTLTVDDSETEAQALAVLKCLYFFSVFLETVQCILAVDNMVKYLFLLRPLSILHNRCHSMCMYSFTLIMTLSSCFFFLDITKQAIKYIFLMSMSKNVCFPSFFCLTYLIHRLSCVVYSC